MDIQNCTKPDFDQILADIVDFWGSDRTLHLHQPTLIYEFGNTAYVIKEQDCVIAYLFGFLSQRSPTAYVHLIGVRRSHQKQGLGHKLYAYFIDYAVQQGCTRLKAITTPTNATSIAFHKNLGMALIGEPDENGIPIVRDYSGPGQHRVVFDKAI